MNGCVNIHTAMQCPSPEFQREDKAGFQSTYITRDIALFGMVLDENDAFLFLKFPKLTSFSLSAVQF